MLRPYNLTYSDIHRLQAFVNYIMLEVIFRTPKTNAPKFSSALVLPKYRNLIDGVNAIYVLNPLTDVYNICQGLTPAQLKTLRRSVHNNNKIRELCEGNVEPVTYDLIKKIDPNLKISLKKFCDYLYDEVIGLAPCYHMYEKIDGYYKRLVKRSSVCRCCGIHKVLTQYHTHRSALDHYLPRKHYPFNSVNFKNLLPICEICNGKYKLAEDPLCKIDNKGKKSEVKTRYKAFYPFSRTTLDIDIHIKLLKVKSIKILEPENIEIKLSCNGYEEQVETWDRLFGIKENYAAECCTDEMLLYLEEQYMAEMINQKTHREYVDLLANNKYGDMNFLKIPFLNAVAT